MTKQRALVPYEEPKVQVLSSSHLSSSRRMCRLPWERLQPCIQE